MRSGRQASWRSAKIPCSIGESRLHSGQRSHRGNGATGTLALSRSGTTGGDSSSAVWGQHAHPLVRGSAGLPHRPLALPPFSWTLLAEMRASYCEEKDSTDNATTWLSSDFARQR